MCKKMDQNLDTKHATYLVCSNSTWSISNLKPLDPKLCGLPTGYRRRRNVVQSTVRGAQHPPVKNTDNTQTQQTKTLKPSLMFIK